MKRILKSLFSLFLILFVFVSVGCSENNSDTPNSQDTPTTPTINEEYYKKLGYHTITYDSNILIECTDENVVIIDTTKIMTPNNTSITIKFNETQNTGFENNNGKYINFSNGTYLSGFSVNTLTYNGNSSTIKVTTDLTISAKFTNFKTIGAAAYAIIPEDEESSKFKNNEFDELLTFDGNQISTTLNNMFYFYATNLSLENYQTDKLKNNIVLASKTTIVDSQKFNANVAIEFPIDANEVYAYLLLVDENNNLILYFIENSQTVIGKSFEKSNISNSNSNLNSITIKLVADITTTDEYKK